MKKLDIKNTIGIVSCKGGVGKSTASVNIALSLNIFCKNKVGLLDADIYGPNHPRMLGVNDKISKNISNNIIIPKSKYNILSMSMGYFLDEDSSVLLRGPMLGNTILYLLYNTSWGNLDTLVIDFPPGTGDIYLSLFKHIKLNGVILVATPQSVVLDDLIKSLVMLKKFNIPILGLLNNMSSYICSNCGFKDNIYGTDKELRNIVKKFNIPFSYNIPLDKKISMSCDIGIPMVIKYPDSDISNVYKKISNSIIS